MQLVMLILSRLGPICHAFFVLFIILSMIVIPCYILFIPEWKQYAIERKFKDVIKKKPYIKYVVVIIGLAEYLYIMLALYLSLR